VLRQADTETYCQADDDTRGRDTADDEPLFPVDAFGLSSRQARGRFCDVEVGHGFEATVGLVVLVTTAIGLVASLWMAKVLRVTRVVHGLVALAVVPRVPVGSHDLLFVVQSRSVQKGNVQHNGQVISQGQNSEVPERK